MSIQQLASSNKHLFLFSPQIANKQPLNSFWNKNFPPYITQHFCKVSPVTILSAVISSLVLNWSCCCFCFTVWYRIQTAESWGEMIKLLRHWDVWTAVRCDCLPGRLAHYRLMKQGDKPAEWGVLARLYLICLSEARNIFPTPGSSR